jgi:hypothetical protein
MVMSLSHHHNNNNHHLHFHSLNEPKTLTMSHEQQHGGFFNHHYEYPYWQNLEMEPPFLQFHHPTNTFPLNASSASYSSTHHSNLHHLFAPYQSNFIIFNFHFKLGFSILFNFIDPNSTFSYCISILLNFTSFINSIFQYHLFQFIPTNPYFMILVLSLLSDPHHNNGKQRSYIFTFKSTASTAAARRRRRSRKKKNLVSSFCF